MYGGESVKIWRGSEGLLLSISRLSSFYKTLSSLIFCFAQVKISSVYLLFGNGVGT